MKSMLLTGVAATAAALVAPAPLRAQSLTITDPAFTASALFQSTPGFTFGGLAFDAAGNAFYIENDTSSYSANAVLYRRTAADNYATPTLLRDLGAFSFGSFVIAQGGKVYFGESNSGGIGVVNADGSGFDALGTVAFNFDAAFAGGSLFLSHNAESNFNNPPKNRVSRFTLGPDGGGGLMLGAGDVIIAADNDYSGPLEFDAVGDLFYGASGAFDDPPAVTGLYRYSAAEVAGAFGAGQLTVDVAHRLVANTKNYGLAFGGGDDLWQSVAGSLSLIDTDDGSVQPIGSTAGSVGALDYAGTTLYAGVTNDAFNRSAAYAVVPEPSASLLLLGGLALLARRRR